jgi:hypothetical protein
MFIKRHRTESLLEDAGRSREVIVGWICALISGVFAIIFGWVLYLVAWRNPREYGVNELYEITTLVILGVLVVIAVGFFVIALRLLARTPRKPELMSPMLLRIWGALFGLGGVVILLEAILRKRWSAIPHYWAILLTSFSMACAAFSLARRRKRREARRMASPTTQRSEPEPAG